MTTNEMVELKKGIALTAAYYGRDLTLPVIEMMANDLSDLPFLEVSAAFANYRRDPKNRTFPVPAQIRELVRPTPTPEQQARELVARILEAQDRFGYTWPHEAKAFIGEIGWSAVRTYGGWQNFCEGLGHHFSVDQFSAQVRELLKGRIQHGASLGDAAAAIDYKEQSKVASGDPMNLISIKTIPKE